MPKSSRSKSHKQSSKHTSSSTAREYSGSDDDVKTKERSTNGGKEDIVSVRVSSEKRKHSKDLLISHVNGDVVSEKNHGGSDRWNGGNSDVVVNVDNKEVSKSKASSESKNKSGSSSRRHESDSVVVVDDLKSGSSNTRSEKRKSEKESGRKESLYKENKDKESKDKDRSSDRGRKGHSDKVEVDGLIKQGDNQSSKRGKEITDWPIEEELRNRELEKELEKRIRRKRESSNEKDKYQDDVKETDDKRNRTKDEKHKNEEYVDIIKEDDYKETRQKDEKHREDGERDRKNRDVKHRGESERYSKHRDDKSKYREDKYNEDDKYKDEKYVQSGDKDERIRDGKRKQDDDRDYYKHKEDKHRDVRTRDDYDREKRSRDSKYTSKDHNLEPETKRLRDDRNTSNRDKSPVYDDRVTRYKDEKDRRRDVEKDESSEYRSRSMKDQRSESDKRSSGKVDPVSERVRPGSRYTDVEVTASHSRRRSSPSGSSYPARDHYRVSKREETKYRDYTYEDQTRYNKDYKSVPGQSDKKVAPKDESYSRPDIRSSPQVDKSPSSTSNERRNMSRPDTRKSLDLYEPGPKSGGSKDTVKDKDPDNEFLQPDNDNISVSSPYIKNSHFSGNNSKSLLPPPSPSPSTYRTGSDSPFFGSSEDDRNKSNNRHRRMVDPNMGRGQSNWKNIPNWSSQMSSGGYIPFQVPPPMFHPLMQQFPPPMFGRPPMKLNPGLPYHLPDHGRPPMHGWDANNNGVFGDESNLYGRVDWDRRTHGWGQNGGPRLDVQTGPTQDGYSARGPTLGQTDESEQNQPDIQSESLNLETSVVEAQKAVISPAQIIEPVKKDDNALMSKAYLSRVDVSRDLTHPELYDRCTSMMNLDQEHVSDEFDCKILFLEEGVEANNTDSVSLFTAVNDSVFQKAMLIYKKQKDECYSTKGGSDDDVIKPVMEVNQETDEPPIQKLDTEANAIAESAKTEEPMDVEVDRTVVKQEEEPDINMAAVEESVAPFAEVAVMPTESTNDEKNDGDVATAEVAVMPRELIEFGSVNLNRIHDHSPESTH